MNGIPRNHLSSVMVPQFSDVNDTVCNTITPYYFAARTNNFVKPFPSSLPRFGFQANSVSVHKKVCPVTRQVLLKEVSTLFSGGYLLENIYDLLNVPKEYASVYSSTVETYERIRNAAVNESKSVIEGLLRYGRSSVLNEVVGGHQDTQVCGKKAEDDRNPFHSKFVLALGMCRKIKGPSSGVPVSSLAFPTFRIYTSCRALQDLELHSLQNIMHFGSRLNKDGYTNFRGATGENSSGAGYFFELGCAVTRIAVTK